MSVFAAVRVILAPTPAVNSVALLLHTQQFPSFSPDAVAAIPSENHMVRHPRCVFINYNWIMVHGYYCAGL